MLFFVTGASTSGKSSILPLLRDRFEFPWHDFDSVGVPSPIPSGWRHQTLEHWVTLALESGTAFGVVGQVPYGEILASPSTDQLQGLAVCLLDCSDAVRNERLKRRGDEPSKDQLNWARWMRKHAQDPTWEPHVIVDHQAKQMRWERWRSVARWRCPIIDTSALSLEEVAARVARWVDSERVTSRIFK